MSDILQKPDILKNKKVKTLYMHNEAKRLADRQTDRQASRPAVS